MSVFPYSKHTLGDYVFLYFFYSDVGFTFKAGTKSVTHHYYFVNTFALIIRNHCVL